MSKQILLVVVAAILATIGVVVLYSEIRTAPNGVESSETETETPQATEPEGESQAASSEPRVASRRGGVDSRAAAQELTVQLACEVRSSSGDPLEGALVSWCPLDFYQASMSVSPIDWVVLEASTSYSHSDDMGIAQLSSDSLDRKGALWVTLPGYEPKGAVINGSGSRQIAFKDRVVHLTLTPSDQLSVVVGRGNDTTVASATVVQRYALSHAPGGETEALYSLFVRSKLYVAPGAVLLAAERDVFVYQAQSEVQVSERTSHVGGGVLSLQLGNTFNLDVRTEGPLPIGSDCKVAIHHLASDGILDSILILTSEVDGDFGSAMIPSYPDGPYRIVLDGHGIMTQEHVISAPPASGRERIVFPIKASKTVKLYIHDREGSPILNASVRPQWSGIDSGQGIGLPRTLSDSKGDAVVSSLPDGVVSLELNHPDYLPMSIGPFLADSLVDEVIDVTLIQPATLRGTVTFQGKPVENFHVSCWIGDWVGWTSIDVTESADGAFIIDSAPMGEVSVVASALGYGQSRVAIVTVTADQGGDVTLELTESVVGRGFVLDDDTGEPIAGAQVVLWTLHSTDPIETTGEQALTAADGSFQLDGFAPGAASASVYADGYVSSAMTATGSASKGPDFGTIRLLPSQPLVVQFRSPGITDWSVYMVEASGVGYMLPEGLAADGVVTLPGGRRGEYKFVVTAPDGTEMWERFMVWGPGPWVKQVDFGVQATYNVRLLGTKEQLTGVGGVMVSESRAFREASGGFKPLESGTREFSITAFGEGPHLVTVTSKTGGTWNRLMIPAGSASGTTFELNLEDRKDAVVRVVNGGGEPLQGLYVSFRSKLNPASFVDSATTDSEGLAYINRLDEWEGELVIRDQARVGMFGLAVEFPTDGSPLEVVWNVVTDLRLNVHDGGVALEGLDVWIHTPGGVSSIDLMNVTKEGVVFHQGLAPGEYLLQPGGNWVWPDGKSIHVTEDGFSPSSIEFLRRGDLLITVRDEFGNPLSGIPLSLSHEGFEESVADGVDDGLVTAPGGLTTDKNGTVLLLGLPHGQVLCTLPGGSTKTLTVPASAMGEEMISQ